MSGDTPRNPHEPHTDRLRRLARRALLAYIVASLASAFLFADAVSANPTVGLAPEIAALLVGGAFVLYVTFIIWLRREVSDG